MPSRRLRAVLSLGCILGLGVVGTSAAWSDEATAVSGTFSTGSVDIQLNNSQGNPTAYAFTTLNMSSMKPGQSKAATLPVQNKGTLPFNYSMSTSASGALAPYLTVAIYPGGSASNSGNIGSCTGSALSGHPAALSSVTVPSRGPLAATSGSETLCFLVALSATAPTSVQSATASATFTFTATGV